MTRTIAAMLFVVGVGALWSGVLGIVEATDRARFHATVAMAYHTKLDSKDWAAHTRLNAIELAMVGGLVAVAGVGLWQKRPGALVLFALTMTALMVTDLAKYYAGYSRYVFELPDLMGTGLYLLAITAATVGFLDMRRRERLSAGT